MVGVKLRVSGRWGHFRKPETNNNPLTHDFVTKTALIGLIGAVLGVERQEMKLRFPTLSEDLLYGVQLNGVVRKESWAFTMRNAYRPNDPAEKAPRQMEFLREPDLTVAVGARDTRSSEFLGRFASAVRRGEACYTPVLGLHNCPAELVWLWEGEFSAASGAYRTKGFALRSHWRREGFDFSRFHLGFERIPTYQDAEWWNPPDGYREVMYPSSGAEVAVTGDHFFTPAGEEWCLI